MKLMARLILTLFVMTLATMGYASFQGFSGTTDLKIFNKIKCSTGLTCTRTGDGLFTMVSSPVATTVGGFQVLPANATDGIFTISADNSDDNGDDWAIKSVASGNALIFQNDTSGSLATKLTLSTAGVLTLGGALTLTDAETISNPSDDVVRLSSNDSSLVVDAYSPNTSDGDSIFRMTADAGADNGDVWQMKHTGSTNALEFQNNTSGSQVTKLTLSTAGVATFAGALTLSDAETISNPTDDTVRVSSNDSSLVLDVYSPNTSNGDASITLTADAAADNGDIWQLKHTGSTNAFALLNNTSGSQVAKMTLSTAGAMTSVVSITGAGTGALSGYLQSQVASTTTTITAAQCGSTFVSNSADVMGLPEASTVLGCRLTFICGTADNFDINPDDADVILPTGALTPSAGDAIRCTDAGAGFVLEAISASEWAVLSTNGTITDVD